MVSDHPDTVNIWLRRDPCYVEFTHHHSLQTAKQLTPPLSKLKADGKRPKSCG